MPEEGEEAPEEAAGRYADDRPCIRGNDKADESYHKVLPQPPTPKLQSPRRNPFDSTFVTKLSNSKNRPTVSGPTSKQTTAPRHQILPKNPSPGPNALSTAPSHSSNVRSPILQPEPGNGYKPSIHFRKRKPLRPVNPTGGTSIENFH